MTLIIQKPTGAKLVLAKGYPNDPDVLAYIAAVQAADESASPGIGALEIGTVKAIDDFVTGCKSDGIWTAIKASCILAGARTLAGALVPLVGTSPTSFNFVSGDYNRKTGLVGDGSTKYLDSNRNNNADPQNSFHISVYPTSTPNISTCLIGSSNANGRSLLFRNSAGDLAVSNRDNLFGLAASVTSWSNSLFGTSRSGSASHILRKESMSSTLTNASQTPLNSNISIFALTGPSNFSNVRITFYSIGESLNLALLDARVTDLINAFGAAIP
jgi:hypothetical protein